VGGRRLLLAFALLLLGAGGALLGRRVYLEAKALLAQRLIDRAFAAHLRDGRPHRPWTWADTYPIAVLELDRLDVRRSVLAGASGTSLAFGVGHVDGTAGPNSPGNCVLAGHRDRAFAFLEKVRPGDVLRLRTADAAREYVVETRGVVERTDVGALQPAGGHRRLTLVTCYPFGGLLRSPLRYVVTAGATRRGVEEAITISSSSGTHPSQQ
jgi:sortase A